MYVISTLYLLDQSSCIPACLNFWSAKELPKPSPDISLSWKGLVLSDTKRAPHSHWPQAATQPWQDLALDLPTPLHSPILQGNETSYSAVLILVWPLHTPYTVNLKFETALTDILLNAYNYVLNSSIAVHVLTGVPQIIWSVLGSWLGSFTGVD